MFNIGILVVFISLYFSSCTQAAIKRLLVIKICQNVINVNNHLVHLDSYLVHFHYDYIDRLVRILKKLENGRSFNDHLVHEE